MKHLAPLLILLIIFSCTSKTPINKEALSRELDSIFQADQQYRMEIMEAQKAFGFNAPQTQSLWAKQMAIDSSNLQRIVEIIEQVGGYPGKSMLDYPANEVTFYVLQHAPISVQEKYYDLIVEAAQKNELNKGLAAMYQDRYLMHHGKSQIFGTQVRFEQVQDSATGAMIDSAYVWPIADTTRIDSLRMWNGLGPLEEYIQGFGLSRWK